jgi:hypothetical protein
MKTFTNTEYGIESMVVAQYQGGYAVDLRDTDADMRVGDIRIFKTEDEAVAYAKELVA